jgi:hypothetical protein
MRAVTAIGGLAGRRQLRPWICTDTFELYAAGLPGSSHLSLEPELEGGPVRLSLARGETAELPCRVKNLGNRHIIWRRGFDVSVLC